MPDQHDAPFAFPAQGHGHFLPLDAAKIAPVRAIDQRGAGLLLDQGGPAGALALTMDGDGYAIQFGTLHEILRLVVGLLDLHDTLAARDAARAQRASAELGRVVAAHAAADGEA